MKKYLVLLCLISLAACTRIPTGSFGTAGDASTVSPVVNANNAGTQAEVDLRRQTRIDEKINEKSDSLDKATETIGVDVEAESKNDAKADEALGEKTSSEPLKLEEELRKQEMLDQAAARTRSNSDSDE